MNAGRTVKNTKRGVMRDDLIKFKKTLDIITDIRYNGIKRNTRVGEGGFENEY